jgi:TonB family protein
MSRWRGATVALIGMIATLGMATPAFADIKAYNAAVLKGDFAGAANEVASTWPALDKSRDDIFAIAQEFAWTAMLAKKPKLAQTVLSSLSGSTAVDSSSDVTAVLAAWADFSVNADSNTRKALLAALEARAQLKRSDLISIRASQEFFVHQWDRDKFAEAAHIAALGAKFAEQAGSDTIDVAYAMRRNERVARFLDRRSRAEVDAIDALVTEIEGRLAQERNPGLRERFISQLATTIAWREVERNVMEFGGRRLPREPEDNENKQDEEWFPTPGDSAVPICKLSLDTAGVSPKYPRKAASKRLPGFAMYAFDVTEGGKYKSARVLGSAPHEMFTETIDEILPAWKWKMSEKNPPGDCRLPSVHIVAFDFEMRSR